MSWLKKFSVQSVSCDNQYAKTIKLIWQLSQHTLSSEIIYEYIEHKWRSEYDSQHCIKNTK